MSSTYLTSKHVLERYKISNSTLYEMIRRGELPSPVKFGTASRWRLSDLEEAERALRPSTAAANSMAA